MYVCMYIYIYEVIYSQQIHETIHVKLYIYNAVDYIHSYTIEVLVLIEECVTYTSGDYYGMHNLCKHVT